MDKHNLLTVMNRMDFCVVDIAYKNGQEFYAHKMNDSDELAWFPVSSGGHGFVQLFKGQIKEACKNEQKSS